MSNLKPSLPPPKKKTNRECQASPESETWRRTSLRVDRRGVLTQLLIAVHFGSSTIAGAATVAVAAGYAHSLFMNLDGSISATGNNLDGQLGDATIENKNIPITFAFGPPIQAVSAGGYHSLFLSFYNKAFVVGSNSFGQLGDGTMENKLSPVEVSLTGIDSVAAGYQHSLINAYGWARVSGRNNAGQLGDGTNKDTSDSVA